MLELYAGLTTTLILKIRVYYTQVIILILILCPSTDLINHTQL